MSLTEWDSITIVSMGYKTCHSHLLDKCGELIKEDYLLVVKWLWTPWLISHI